jgi:integrase
MSPSTVTPEPPDHMPRQQGLLPRGNRWYSNFKVPNDLQAALGKTHIRESLGTSDYREACRKVTYERARATALFEDARRRMARKSSPPAKDEKTTLTVISDQEAYRLCVRYLASFEHKCKKWMSEEGRFLESHQREEMASNVKWDAFDLETGQEFRGKPLDGTDELQAFLRAENIECAVSSPAFQTLRPLFLEAHLEYLGRYQDVLQGQPIKERNRVFKDVHAFSPEVAKAEKSPTVDELLSLRERVVKDFGLSQKTADAAHNTARLMREHFGGGRQLATIAREDIQQLFDLLRRAPTNATKRYKGMTLPEAIAAADKAGDGQRLSPKTLHHHYIQISALFNLAVDEKMLKESPANSRFLRKSIEGNVAKAPREQFTIDELNRLFRTEAFMGEQPTELLEKGGHFWVPILALFHGMRCNEACQLYTEDVKSCEGITFIAIREEREDGTRCVKKLKTKQSRRDVPLHPELEKLGFLRFVEERQKNAACPRLFPELTPGHKGYFSDAFSKWFARYVKNALGEQCRATMHSFRHQFRDATRAARLPAETVARLAGWEDGESPMSRQISQYGRGPEYLRILAEDIAKVNYPGLNIAHLYACKDHADPSPRVHHRED